MPCDGIKNFRNSHKRRDPLRGLPNTYLDITSIKDFKIFIWKEFGYLAHKKMKQVAKICVLGWSQIKIKMRIKFKFLDPIVNGNAHEQVYESFTFNSGFFHKSIKPNHSHKEGKHFSTSLNTEYVILCCPGRLIFRTVSTNWRWFLLSVRDEL